MGTDFMMSLSKVAAKVRGAREYKHPLLRLLFAASALTLCGITEVEADQIKTYLLGSAVASENGTTYQNASDTTAARERAACGPEIYAYLRVLTVSREIAGTTELFTDALDDLKEQADECLEDDDSDGVLPAASKTARHAHAANAGSAPPPHPSQSPANVGT